METVELLEEEIGRARIVPSENLPADTVAMNSTITFIDLDTQKEQRVTLVYPHEANIDDGRISILAPVGVALIGLRVGQQIEWPVTDKKVRRIKVTAVNRERRARRE